MEKTEQARTDRSAQLICGAACSATWRTGPVGRHVAQQFKMGRGVLRHRVLGVLGVLWLDRAMLRRTAHLERRVRVVDGHTEPTVGVVRLHTYTHV